MDGISFEVFPPKKEGDFATAYNVVERLADMSPEFISVTYGAGGSHSKKTLDIASYIHNELHVPAIAHITCVGSTKEQISVLANGLKKENVSHVLALRGDRPKSMTDEQYEQREFTYALDLIRFLKEEGGLHILGACYPEKHFEALSLEDDLGIMREKQDLGVEGFISQLFFDNDVFYKFLDMTGKYGISAPIHAGIMPVTSAKQLGTSVSLSGSSVPKKMADLIANHSDNAEDMYKYGIDYAIGQINDLIKNGVKKIHIYTMNKPEIAKEIFEGIRI